MAKRKQNQGSFIASDYLYTLPAFLDAAGIGRSTITRARTMGIELVKLRCGRRCYIRGADGIAFIEQYAKALNESGQVP